MSLRLFTRRPAACLWLLALLCLHAGGQTGIPGGANSNPTTADGRPIYGDPDKPSGDDEGGPGNRPPGPTPARAEGQESCEDLKREAEALEGKGNPQGRPPGSPGSVDLNFTLAACPLEKSVASGSLRLYFEEPVENMGDPVFLKYNSLAEAEISSQVTTGLPAGVAKRITVNQLSGKPLSFELRSGESVMKPYGSGGASRARVELRTNSGTTTDLGAATIIRQYRSAGGYMDLDAATGKIKAWAGPTGRTLDLSTDPESGPNAAGLEVLRNGDAVRQVKSRAGLLDIVPDASGRGYRVITYLPSEVGSKAGTLYQLVSDAKPKQTVHVVHPLGTQRLVVTYTDHSPDGSPNREQVLTYQYKNAFDGGHEWTLTTESGESTFVSTRRVIPDLDQDGLRKVVRELKDGTGRVLVHKEMIQKYETSWEGWTDLKEIEIPANDASQKIVRSFRYGTDPGANDFRRVNWQTNEAGITYTFKYDAQGRMIERVRPWLDGAGGQSLIETYDYTPHGPGEVVAPGDERPRTTTVEIGTPGAGSNKVVSRSFFAAYNDAANGNCHTVVMEDAATPSAAYGAAGNRRKVDVFYAAGAGVEAGRLKESSDETGVKFVTTYAAGTADGLIETTSGPLSAAGLAKAGYTKRMRFEKDAIGRVLLRRESIYNGSGYSDLAEDSHTYARQGQLLKVVRTDLVSSRQRQLSAFEWNGTLMTAMTNGEGKIIRRAYNGAGLVSAITAGAMPEAASPLGGAAFPAMPDVVSAMSGQISGNLQDKFWGNKTEVQTANGATLVTSRETDGRGRITRTTDADGYERTYTYTRAGMTTRTVLPDGSTVTEVLHLDGRLKERSGTSISGEYYSYAPRTAGGLITTVRIGSPASPRYRKTETDMLGRNVAIEAPSATGAQTLTSTFLGGSSLPLCVVSTAPNTPRLIYEYDAFATVSRQGESVRSGATSFSLSSSDRIYENETSFLSADGIWEVKSFYLYPNEGGTAGVRKLVSQVKCKIAGFPGYETSRTSTVDAFGNWILNVVEERPDVVRIERSSSNAFAGENIRITRGDMLVEERAAADSGSTRYGYDAFRRLVSTKMARFTNAGEITYSTGGTLMLSSTDAHGATTQYSYFSQGSPGAGQVAAITYSNATVRRFAYDLRGKVTSEWGSATAPLSYVYDGLGQLVTLSTYRAAPTGDNINWPGNPGDPDSTTWTRDPATGLVTAKTDSHDESVSFTYDGAGRQLVKTSARGTTATSAYTVWGELASINYSGTTPDVAYSYDRVGRVMTMGNGVATTSYEYSPSTLKLARELVSYDLNQDHTPELVREIERTRDSLLRPTGYQLGTDLVTEAGVNYGYDAAGRLSTVSSAQLGNFAYTYKPNSSLVQGIAGPAHTVANAYEANRDVLDVRTNTAGSTVVSRFDYTVNSMGLRSNVAQSGSAFTGTPNVAWSYNGFRELTAADSSVSGQDRSFEYDSAGNRKKSAASLTLPSSDNYAVNALNQYTGINTVTPSYDEDGNALAYPLPVNSAANADLTWDAADRLVTVDPGPPNFTYHYDALGRRIAKSDGTTTTYYVYDDWNCIAEYVATGSGAPFPSRLYLWGKDGNAPVQGGGGTGGLLTLRTSGANYFPLYDGGGNISEYLNAAGAIAAHFEYDPFGNAVVDTDSSGFFNLRFATKRLDAETGLYYYGYRYYDPRAGRWISRDPISESGGANLYGFVGNDGVNQADYLGMYGFWDSVGDRWTGIKQQASKDLGDIFGGAAQQVGNAISGAGTAIKNEVVEIATDPLGWGDKTLYKAGVVAEQVVELNDWGNRFVDDPMTRAAAGQAIVDSVDSAMNYINMAIDDPECFKMLLRDGISLTTMAMLSELGMKGANMALEAAVARGLGTALEADINAARAAAREMVEEGCVGNCFMAGTLVATAEGARPIESLKVGDRVLSGDQQTGSTAVDEASWRKIVLTMANPDQPIDLFEIEMLRSADWIGDQACVVGGEVELVFEEWGIQGMAKVVAIQPCPAITEGHGRVVLSTITHLNSCVQELRFSQGEKTLQVTNTHLLYSETRGDWVPAEDFVVGEKLRTKTGSLALLSTAPKPGTYRVYNIEVETDHCFFAGNEGILSHNVSGGCPPQGYGPLPPGEDPYQLKLFPDEAYDRTTHYGHSPTTAQKRMADPGSFDHDPPLVEHYWEGDGKGGLPGYNLTQTERLQQARSMDGNISTTGAQKAQGADTARYSSQKNREFGDLKKPGKQ